VAVKVKFSKTDIEVNDGKFPLGHTQEDELEYFPAEQDWQVAMLLAATTALKVPGAHSLQTVFEGVLDHCRNVHSVDRA